MRCKDDRLPVLRGNNQWILARTDRDDATRQDVRETAGGFLSKVLGPASAFAQRSLMESVSLPGSKTSKYLIGSARPVYVGAYQPEDVLEAMSEVAPDGTSLGVYTQCSVVRSVSAQRPWIVTVDFDWRGRDVTIPWPRRKVGIDPGTGEDNTLDWLLLMATWTGPARHKDTTRWKEVEKYARDHTPDLPKLGQSMLGWAALGAGAVLTYYAIRTASK